MVRITISGACLASLLHTVSSAQGPCDGLLYGSFSTRVSSTAHDNIEDVQQLHEEIIIAQFSTKLIPCSFYNSVGDISGDKLQSYSASASCPLIGWFSFFPSGAPTPSIREQAVHTNLQRSMRQQHPSQPAPLPIFIKIGLDHDHWGATLNLIYKSFTSSEKSGRMLEPVDMQVPNLNTKLGGQEYSSFPAAQFPLVLPAGGTPDSRAASSSGSRGSRSGAGTEAGSGSGAGASSAFGPWDGSSGAGGGTAAVSSMLQSAVDANASGISTLQGAYADMLQRMRDLAQQVAQEEDAIEGLRQERAALLKELVGTS